MGNASLAVGAITVIDGIAGTLVGGWIAQRWLRTNHRALYLLSFWSVALTLPCGVLVFFGPANWAIPALFAAEFFLFLNTGPLNAAIVNAVNGPVRATAIAQSIFHPLLRRHLLAADHRLFSDRVHSLRIALGATLVAMIVSCVILSAGARFAPRLEERA